MSTIDFTSADEVRALLGVSDEELEDETLLLPNFYTGLVEDLYEVDLSLPARYDTIKAMSAPRTDVEERFYALTRQFASLSIARQLKSSLSMLAPKTIGDGKATVSRFNDPVKDTIKWLDEQFDVTRARLAKAFASLTTVAGVTVARVFLLTSTNTYDPVIGDQ